MLYPAELPGPAACFTRAVQFAQTRARAAGGATLFRGAIWTGAVRLCNSQKLHRIRLQNFLKVSSQR
jgi:hypothetical protein